MITLEDGAIFIADAHYDGSDKKILKFLEDIKSNKIKTTQIFFLGDIFYLFIGSRSGYFNFDTNKKLIELINSLVFTYEVYFFEGNHDFLLKGFVSSRVAIFKIDEQPVICKYKDKKILLGHGDSHSGNYIYNTYVALVRSKKIIAVLDFINTFTKGYVARYISKKLLNEDNLYKKIDNFENIAKNRVKKYLELNYDFNYCIEGHYHQGSEFMFNDKKYINIKPFFQNGSYIQFSSDDDGTFHNRSL